jgi:excisionase family DNA binding protein
MTVPDNQPWLDVRAAASRAAVSTATILRELRTGRLRGYRVGGRKCWRVKPEDVDAWLMKTGKSDAAAPLLDVMMS